jgi:hypothetical protein
MLNYIEQTVGIVPEEQMAEWLGVKLETAEAWRKRGIGLGTLAVKLGTRWFYRIDDLRSHVASQAVGRRSNAQQMVGEL